MTIKVQTPDFGVQSFEADDWDINEDTGTLWVGDRSTKEGVASFAKGAWLFVWEEVADKRHPAEPRVWDSVFDIPVRTLVTGGDGKQLLIVARGEGWYINEVWPLESALSRKGGWRLSGDDNRNAPFTEVIQ